MFVLVFITYLATLIIVTLIASSATSGLATIGIVAAIALFGALAVGGAARLSDRESPTREEAEDDPHDIPQHATRELHPDMTRHEVDERRRHHDPHPPGPIA
jgi:hypothetical protein